MQGTDWMRNKVSLLVLGGLLTVVGLLLTGWSQTGADDFHRDEQRIIKLADNVMKENYSTTLKYGSPYRGYRTFREFAESGHRLSHLLGLPPGTADPDFNRHPLYQTQTTSPEGIRISLRLVGTDGGEEGVGSGGNGSGPDGDDGGTGWNDGNHAGSNGHDGGSGGNDENHDGSNGNGDSSDGNDENNVSTIGDGSILRSTYFMVTLEGDGRNALSVMESRRAALNAKLQALGFASGWNINVQGDARIADDPVKELRELAFAELRAKPVGETYEDARTHSATYDSPMLRHKLKSGSRFINLQTALHRDSIDNHWRVTLGSPIIAIEF